MQVRHLREVTISHLLVQAAAVLDDQITTEAQDTAHNLVSSPLPTAELSPVLNALPELVTVETTTADLTHQAADVPAETSQSVILSIVSTDLPGSSSTAHPTAITKGKTIGSFVFAEPEEDSNIEGSQLDTILTSLQNVQQIISSLKTDRLVTSSTVKQMTDSVAYRMKNFSKELSDLVTDLQSKHAKTTLRTAQSKEFLSTKINYFETTMLLKFESVEAKLATISDVLFRRSQPTSSVIDKKEGTEREKDSKKRSESEYNKKDKGLEKRPEKRSKF